MHGGNLRELKLMDAVAHDPLKVLYWATGSAAELLQIDDRVGTIAPGRQADLVVVDGDPFDFAAYPGNIRAVYRRGRLVRGAV
jgi:imidazolonepropionase-like amidohydrolase